MKKILKNFIVYSIYFLLISLSCERTDQENIIEVKNFKYNGCKNTQKGIISDQEYIRIKEIDNNYLYIEHINLIFNCCPGRLFVNAKFTNNEIIFEEGEEEHGCNCVCPYDLSCEIGPIEYKSYQFKVMQGELVYADFSIEFTASLDSTFYIN
ncbi:hypothetical protein ES705_44315 [subsurface metagenome]